MSLLGFLFSPEKKLNANLDLAEALLAAQNLSADENSTVVKKSKKVEKVLQTCTSRQAILDKVIELCGDPAAPRQKYIRAVAYTRAKADYREDAIKALELYLADAPYENSYKNEHHFWGRKPFSREEEKKIHLADMYYHLGKEYEGKHSFNQALTCFNKELELTPFYPGPYCRISSIHIKKNQLTSAMNTLLGAKKTSCYKPLKYKTPAGDQETDDTFKKVIDNHILDLEKKIETGYVYAPKKKRRE